MLYNYIKYGYVLPDDGSHGIRNMLGVTFNFMCFKLLYNIDFNY